MARQVQLRRGTTAENNVFTGAIGELTMDTDTNGLRIHDGVTVGGQDVPTAATADYVVETQLPTADNSYTWYRKYKSGWVEQGGVFTPKSTSSGGGTIATITLPIEMSDNKYWWSARGVGSASSGAYLGVARDSTTSSTSLVLKGWCIVAQEASWQVSGMAAS